jgi:hypothetical protein
VPAGRLSVLAAAGVRLSGLVFAAATAGYGDVGCAGDTTPLWANRDPTSQKQAIGAERGSAARAAQNAARSCFRTLKQERVIVRDLPRA